MLVAATGPLLLLIQLNYIKELLNVKFNLASVSVLDMADIVFSIETLCTE